VEGILVRFSDTLSEEDVELRSNRIAASTGGKVQHVFHNLLKGALIIEGNKQAVKAEPLLLDNDIVYTIPVSVLKGSLLFDSLTEVSPLRMLASQQTLIYANR